MSKKGHTDSCRYCRSSFKFKFPYRKWAQISKVLYDRAVAKFTPVETITFIFDGKPWIIDYTCGEDFGVSGGAVSDDFLTIYLTEPLTHAEAKAKAKKTKRDPWLTPFDEIEALSPDRDMLRLKNISAAAAELDLDIYVCDIFGDEKQHHCGVRRIEGCKDVKIYLEETWCCKD